MWSSAAAAAGGHLWVVACSCVPSFPSCILALHLLLQRGLWTLCTRCSSQPLANKSQLTANCCCGCLQIRHIQTTAIIQWQQQLRAVNSPEWTIGKGLWNHAPTPSHFQRPFHTFFCCFFFLGEQQELRPLSCVDHQPFMVNHFI